MAVAPEPESLTLAVSFRGVHGDEQGRRRAVHARGFGQGRGDRKERRAVLVGEPRLPPPELSAHERRGVN
eukprot:4244420-Pleurochrysis_carterae.AAC.1